MKSTPAQRAIDKKLTNLIAEMDRPFSDQDMDNLKDRLRLVRADSLWGTAILKVFKDGGNVEALIDNLASQAIDDFVTMTEIVGITATLLLLRYYDKTNPKK